MFDIVLASLRFLLVRNDGTELPIRRLSVSVLTGTSVQELIDGEVSKTIDLALGTARRVCTVGGFVITMSDDGGTPMTLYRQQWDEKEAKEGRRFELIFLEEGFNTQIRDIEVLALEDCLKPVPHIGGPLRRPAALETPLPPTPAKRSRPAESDDGDDVALHDDDSGLFEVEEEEQPSDDEAEEDFDEDEEELQSDEAEDDFDEGEEELQSDEDEERSNSYEVEEQSDDEEAEQPSDEDEEHEIEEIFSCIYSNTVFTLLEYP